MAGISASQLQIVITAVDEASAVLQEVAANATAAMDEAASSGSTMIGGINSTLGQTGAVLNAVGGIAGAIAAPINNFTQSGISGATQYQEQLTALNTLLGNQASGTTATATQTQFLADKIANLRAENEKLSTTHQKTAADQAKVNAQIAVNDNQIAMLTQQMNQQSSASQMVGANVGNLMSQFDSTAQSAAKFGFTQQDAMAALTTLQAQTHNSSDTMNDYQVVLDLAAQKHETLQEAVQTMAGAFTGRGMAITQATGIIVKDGLSAQSAFQAVGDVVKGAATKSLQDYGTQQNALSASTNNLQTNALMPLLTVLTTLTANFAAVIDKVEAWTNAHPQLTNELMEFAVVFGGILVAIASFTSVVAPILIALGIFGVSFLTAASGIGIAIAAIVAIIAVGVLLVNNWGYIRDNFAAAWQIISTGFTIVWNTMKNTAESAMTWINNFITSNISAIQTVWNAVWSAMASFFGNIWTGIESAASSAINSVMSKIQAFVSWAQGILAPILGAINAVGNAASVFGKSVAGAVSSAANVLNIHDAIITPSGQVIQSDPADYLFATKNPGSLGGGPGVTVNINGGMFLSDQSATLIANQVAKILNRQLKLRNYAS